eukprot:scpid58089/ scgid7524/ Solute carrier family 46 member 3
MRLPVGCVRLVEVVLIINMAVVAIGVLTSPIVLVERFNKIYNYTGGNAATSPCDYNTSNTSTGSDEDLATQIEAKVSAWTWYTTLLSLLPAVPLTAVVFGPWSDVSGRRPIIILGTLGNFISYMGMLLFHVYELPFYCLILSSLFQGLVGGQAAAIGMSFAYISDVTTREQRTARLTIVEGVVFLASAAGYAIGSNLTQHFNPYVGLSVAAAMMLLQIVYVVFFLQDGDYLGKAAASNGKFESMSVRIRKHLGRIQHVYLSPSEHRLSLWLLLLTFCVLMVVMLGSSTADFLFMRLKPFCLSERNLGYVIIAKSSLFAMYGFILAPLARRIGISDRTLAVTGIIFFAASKVLSAVATDVVFLFIVCVVSMPMVVVAAVCRSMMSKMVDAAYQGTLFSVVAGLEALSSALGSVLYNNCFEKFSSYASLPLVKQPAGYMYFVTASLLIPCPFVLCYVHYRQQSRQRKYSKLPGVSEPGIQADEM